MGRPNMCPINANKYVGLAKPISTKVEETAAFKENPGVFLLNRSPHPSKARSAINLSEPNIIVVKYIKPNSKIANTRL